jgi:hypothetical protein
MRRLVTHLIVAALATSASASDGSPRIDRAAPRAQRLQEQIAAVSARLPRPNLGPGTVCRVFGFTPAILNPGEFVSIQAALSSTSPRCDTIDVDPVTTFALTCPPPNPHFDICPLTTGRTFNESLTIDHDVTIEVTPSLFTPTSRAVIAQPPGFSGSIITINALAQPAPVVHLNYLRINGGAAPTNGGGINNNGGVVFLDHCDVSGNGAGRRGGGIYNSNVGAMVITNSYLGGNYAALGGGAIANSSATKLSVSLMTIQNTTIENNQVQSLAGAVGGAIDQDFGITLITDSTIRNNSATTGLGAYGGAINNNLGGMSITRTTIADNIAKSTLATPPIAGTAISAAGGAINNTGSLVDNSLGVILLDQVTISGNAAKSLYGANGGGINNTAGGTITMTDSAVLSNGAPSGGGIDNGLDGIVSITRSTFAFNTVTSGIFAQGGGLRNTDATVTITDSAFVQNEANGSGRGGAIYFAAKDQGSTITIDNSTFSANVAKDGIGAQGGAVYVSASSGGLPGVSATIDVHDCTFANNDASSDGESFFILGDLATVNVNFSNTILAGRRSRLPHKQAGDPPGTYYATNCYSTSLTGSAHFTSSGHNIDADTTCGLNAATDRTNTDPLLGALAVRGGATPVHSLLPGSPALDALTMGTGGFGDPLASDQRGVTRPQNGLADIGAFERVLGGLTAFSPQFYPNPASSVVRATLDATPRMPVGAGAVVVRSEKRPAVQGTFSLGAGNVVTLTPSTPIPPNEMVHATATAGLVRSDGTPLQNPTQWWFETQGPQWCVGGWSSHQDLSASILGSSVAFGDYDGDGDLDLVATGTGLGQGSDIFRNDGGTFVPLHAGLPSLQDATVAWADIDGDGDLDLLVAGRLTVTPGTFINGYAEIWRNDAGTFVPMQAGLPQYNRAFAAFGDYDNDGRIDFFISGSVPLGPGQFETSSKLYHNEGNGTFTEKVISISGVVRPVWGDFDNDGYLDLAAAGFLGTAAFVLHNDGAGHLGNPTQLTTPVSLGRIAAGDYDGDGKLDLIVGGQVISGTTITPTVTLYHNDTNNTFTPVAAPFIATSDGDVAFIDFDNDGKQDVSIGGTSGGAMAFKLYRNLGGGSFADITTTLPGAGTASISWGDYDNDGHVDLALTGFDGATWFRKIFHHDPCAAVNDTYAATAGTALVVPAIAGVLANDHALLGGTAVRDTNAVHGSVSVNADGSFTYNPPAGSTGPDSFTYHILDASGGSSNIVTVTINVSGSAAVCSTTVDGIFGWTSTDASAVQLAIDAASSGATVKIAGTCAGLGGGSQQIALIAKNLTLLGGFVSSNWTVSDPVTHPTILDAMSAGRVVLTTGASTAVTLDALTMQNGSTSAAGGNIEAAGPLTVTRSTVAGGRAPASSGGGIDARGPLTIRQSLISGNSSPAGAGIFAAGSTLDVRNTTITGNTGGSGGGGIEIAGATATINNATIAGNTAGAGSIFVSSGSATIANSILASSSPNCGALITSNGFNVSTDATCTGGTGDLANTNPQVAALATNGGPTQTRSLPKGSAAIDLGSGTCEAIDQRGVARPAGLSCDAGAFEAPDFRSCNAKVVSNGHVFNGAASDANAIRLAVADAAGTDTILLSGNCTGLVDFGGFTAMVFVSGKTLTFSGGYDPLSFARYDPTAYPTVLDGTPGASPNAPIFRINSNSDTFNDIIFTNAKFRAMNLDGSGGATFNRCAFNNNTSNDGSQGGGAIHIDGGNLTFNNSTFSGNTTTGIAQGGAILTFGSVVLNDSTFTNNSVGGGSSPSGGAITAIGAVTATNTTFTNNTSLAHGGAINAFGGLTVTHCTFTGNHADTTASDGGGAIWSGDGGTISDSTFTGNFAASGGGAIYHSTFSSSRLTISTSTFSSNSVSNGYFGGAISNDSGGLTINDSSIVSNSAGGAGGVYNGGGLTINRSLIDSNSSISGVGGVQNLFGGTTITNSTITRNHGQFGALVGPSLNCFNCTVVGNTSSSTAPVISVSFGNSIIASNGCQSAGASQGHNVSDGAGCGLTDPTDHTNVNPQLGPLQDNGGPTHTYDIAITSPALDAGDCSAGSITVDQRGVARPHGVACDAGAVEHKGIDTTTTLAASTTSTVFGQAVTFTATIAAASGPAPSGTMTFRDGGSPIGTAPIVSGVAVLSTSALSVSGHGISAAFAATSTHEASVSATIPVTVAKATTLISVVGATPEPAGTGASATVTFALHVASPGSGTPTGIVTISDGTRTCTATLPAISCSITPAAAGNYAISASYAGDASYTSSDSLLLTHNVVDATPPQVLAVNSAADTGDATLTQNEVVTVPVTQLILRFSRPIVPALAGNTANYVLVSHAGSAPATTGCAAIGPGDVALTLETAFYDPATTTVTVGVPAALPFGNYRLIACPSLTDADARALDGNGDGTAGDAFIRDFSVSVPPRVAIAAIAEAQVVRASTTQLIAKFDQPMTIGDATDSTRYLLVRPGANNVIDTVSCAAGVAGDDVRVSVSGVSLSGNDATLNIGASLPDSRYRLIVCSTIHSFSGAALDGNSDTVPGDDFVLNFTVDINPPAGTTLISTTHTAGTWSRVSAINMQWNGTTDGVAVAGYSVLFDTLASTDPGGLITIVQGTDPHNDTSGPLTDGASYYFHFRACDVDANCSAVLHRGPFMIDTAPPSAPSALLSSTHTVNVPGFAPAIAMTWAAATDSLSGIAGYGYAFDANPVWPCDQVNRLAATGVTSVPLTPGTWYFHACAADRAGNWSPVATSGPYILLLSTIPHVLSASFNEGQASTVSTAQLTITFDQDVIGAGTAANYQLTNGAVPVSINTAAYDAPSHSATLTVNGGVLLPDGRYRLVASNSIQNAGTIHLDGNLDGIPGDDFIRNFIIDTTPPTDPSTTTSTTHTAGSWSRLTTINMQWSGATDNIGIAGYSVLFDHNAATLPDTTIEVPQSADAHSATSGVLAEGIYYFHLRTCDLAGNCTSTVHAGPYQIDTTPPLNPTAVASTTHQPNVPSATSVIGVAWSDSDALSGIAGYAYQFDTNASWTCDQVNRLIGTTTNSTPLAAGAWYFHVCAVDAAGNWSPSSTAGPFVVVTPGSIPTLDPRVLIMLAIVLASAGVFATRE